MFGVMFWGGSACSVLCMLSELVVLAAAVLFSTTLAKGENVQQTLAKGTVPTLGRKGSPRPGMDTRNEAEQRQSILDVEKKQGCTWHRLREETKQGGKKELGAPPRQEWKKEGESPKKDDTARQGWVEKKEWKQQGWWWNSWKDKWEWWDEEEDPRNRVKDESSSRGYPRNRDRSSSSRGYPRNRERSSSSSRSNPRNRARSSSSSRSNPRNRGSRSQSNKPTLVWQKKELGKIKEEEASASTCPAPLGKGEKLGSVMVDFHNTVEVNDVIPEENQQAIWSLLKKGYEVVVCSFAGRKRALEVNDTMVGQDFYQHLKKCFCIPSRCGNGGKADQCKKHGCTVIFDDGADICFECHNNGLRVFPITHPKEKHDWWVQMGGQTHFTFAAAVKTFLNQEAA